MPHPRSTARAEQSAGAIIRAADDARQRLLRIKHTTESNLGVGISPPDLRDYAKRLDEIAADIAKAASEARAAAEAIRPTVFGPS